MVDQYLFCDINSLKMFLRTSLVVQWLRTHFPIQGMWV